MHCLFAPLPLWQTVVQNIPAALHGFELFEQSLLNVQLA